MARIVFASQKVKEEYEKLRNSKEYADLFSLLIEH
jgi:hypothetical protein